MDILYQIRARQDSFSAGEGRIARLMLEDVGFAASASLEELSQRAEVSTATLSRFARSVGCRDLRDLRLQLAQASGVGSRFLDPAGLPEQSAFHRQILGDIEATLRQHLSGFNQASFVDAVNLLGKARMDPTRSAWAGRRVCAAMNCRCAWFAWATRLPPATTR